MEVNDMYNEVAKNTYGLNLLKKTILDENEESYYFMYNGDADVVALIDVASKTLVATYYYDAFSVIISQTGTVNNSITYKGYQYDEETGLYYLNARMYDPKIARFLQEDSYRGQINDPLSLNLYAYCRNNPIVYWDPSGHYPVEATLKGYGEAMEPKTPRATSYMTMTSLESRYLTFASDYLMYSLDMDLLKVEFTDYEDIEGSQLKIIELKYNESTGYEPINPPEGYTYWDLLGDRIMRTSGIPLINGKMADSGYVGHAT